MNENVTISRGIIQTPVQYYVYIQTNTLGQGMTLLTPPAMC